MDKQKQLNEMHQILLSAGYDWWKTAPNGKTKSEYESECFYNAGYRKIPENAVVLTEEEKSKEVNDLVKEKLKKFAERLKEKLCEFLDDNEDYNGKIDKGICLIDVVGVEALDGEIISLGLIDEICKEITEGCDEGK